MTYDKESFEKLRDTEVKRVRIDNGEHLEVKGKGTVAITTMKVQNLFQMFYLDLKLIKIC